MHNIYILALVAKADQKQTSRGNGDNLVHDSHTLLVKSAGPGPYKRPHDILSATFLTTGCADTWLAMCYAQVRLSINSSRSTDDAPFSCTDDVNQIVEFFFIRIKSSR